MDSWLSIYESNVGRRKNFELMEYLVIGHLCGSININNFPFQILNSLSNLNEHQSNSEY